MLYPEGYQPSGYEHGGEGGIRTLDGLLTHTPLAGERLQPLGHLSGNTVNRTRYSPPSGVYGSKLGSP